MGEEVIEGEIPANLLEDAKKYRAALIERIVEQDDAAMSAYLEGKEPPVDELKAILRKAVINNEIFSGVHRLGAQEQRRPACARCSCRLPPISCRPQTSHRHESEDWRPSRAPRERRRTVLRSRVQTPDRPVCWRTDLLPCLFGNAHGWLVCLQLFDGYQRTNQSYRASPSRQARRSCASIYRRNCCCRRSQRHEDLAYALR